MAKAVEQLEQVTIRFAGDSGDGMQLTGGRFTSETAVIGNDLSTLPDFPAEIRAPAGSLPGVSGFQIHFADHDILTPGDQPDVLVAMNPAALKTNIADLRERGTLIVNRDAFIDRNLQKAGYTANPLEDGTLEAYNVHAVPLSTMTVEALKEVEGHHAAGGGALEELLRARPHVVAVRPADRDDARLHRDEVRGTAELVDGNTLAFKAGYNYGETSEDFIVSYEVRPAKLAPGVYRNITGNQALSLGLVAASIQSGLDLFLGAYPITPASGILEELARYKHFGVRTFQAEDEIAAVGAALGASFGGCARRHDVGRARNRAEVGDRRARGRARAAARDRRRAARRAVHGHADEARAGRPADGDVRPQLRVAGARARRIDARRLL